MTTTTPNKTSTPTAEVRDLIKTISGKKELVERIKTDIENISAMQTDAVKRQVRVEDEIAVLVARRDLLEVEDAT